MPAAPVVILPLSSVGRGVAHAWLGAKVSPTPRSRRRGSGRALGENFPQLSKTEGAAAVRIPLIKQLETRRLRNIEALHQVVLFFKSCDKLGPRNLAITILVHCTRERAKARDVSESRVESAAQVQQRGTVVL